MQENEPPEQAQIKALKQQVKMLRILMVVFAIAMGVAFLSTWRSGQVLQGLLKRLPGATTAEEAPDYVSDEAREQLAKSKAVILTGYKDLGTQLRPVVKEILWLAPGSTFDYAVGDELGIPVDKMPNTRYGDGNVVFCEGVPGKRVHETRSFAIHGEEIPALKMRLAKFRELVAALPKAGEAAAPAEENSAEENTAGSSDDVEDALRTAKAVLITENQNQGTKLRPVITEILWVAPGAIFPHKVGDEFGFTIEKKPGVGYADSNVVICEDLSGTMIAKQNASIFSGDVPAFHMRLEKFRKLVAELPKAEAKAPADGLDGAPGH